VGAVCGWVCSWGTLLGCEGSTCRLPCLFLVSAGEVWGLVGGVLVRVLAWCSCGGGGGWFAALCVENFIVDASIFVVVVRFDKLLRAVGGCLGTKSR
jgi:hypothetical protein